MNKQPEPSKIPKLSIKYFFTQKETSIQNILQRATAKGGETQKAACWWGSLKPEEKRLVCDTTPKTASSSAIQCLLTAETRPFAALCNGLWVAFYPPVTRVFRPCPWVYQLLPLSEQEYVPVELKPRLPIPLADQTRYSVEILHSLKAEKLSSKNVTTIIKRKMAVTLGLNEPVHTFSKQYTSNFHELLICVWQEHTAKQQTTPRVNGSSSIDPSCGRKGIDQTTCANTQFSADTTLLEHAEEQDTASAEQAVNQTYHVGKHRQNKRILHTKRKRSQTFGVSESTLSTHEQAVDKSGHLTFTLLNQKSETLPNDTTMLVQQPPNTQRHTEIPKSPVLTEQCATEKTVSPTVSIQNIRYTKNKHRVLQEDVLTPATINKTQRAQRNDGDTTVLPQHSDGQKYTTGKADPQHSTNQELNIAADQNCARQSVVEHQTTHSNKLALFDEGDVRAFEIQFQRKLEQLEHGVQLLEPQHCSE
jgi:hypothetical protein